MIEKTFESGRLAFPLIEKNNLCPEWAKDLNMSDENNRQQI